MQSLALIATLLVSSSTLTYAEPSDYALESSYWMDYHGAVPDSMLVTNMETQGMTREKLAEVIVHAYAAASGVSVEALQAGEPFTDTQSTMIAKAYQAGLMNGSTDIMFRPDNSISRIEVIEAFEKLLIKMNINRTTTGGSTFSDYASIPSARRTTVSYLYSLGVFNNWATDQFKPNQIISYEDTITLSYRVLKAHNWIDVPVEESASNRENKDGFTVPVRLSTDLIIFEPSSINGIRVLYTGLYFGAYEDKVEKSHRQLIAIAERYGPYKYSAVKTLSKSIEDAWDSVQKEYDFSTDLYINGSTGTVSATNTSSLNYIKISKGNKLIVDFIK